MATPTIEELLNLITVRRPDLSPEQKNAKATRALTIFIAHQDDIWMNPMLAVKMALFEPGS